MAAASVLALTFGLRGKEVAAEYLNTFVEKKESQPRK